MRQSMKLRDRLEIRMVVNLVVSTIERLVNLICKFLPTTPKDKPNPSPDQPNRRRPLKKVVDTIDNIVPLPWRK